MPDLAFWLLPAFIVVSLWLDRGVSSPQEVVIGGDRQSTSKVNDVMIFIQSHSALDSRSVRILGTQL